MVREEWEYAFFLFKGVVVGESELLSGICFMITSNMGLYVSVYV
jgi:hypothetical protein